jgi:diketogulonate reductase-like aldo/keto reductase
MQDLIVTSKPKQFSIGREIPLIGFGTWELSPNNIAKKAVKTALEIGYRLIDTAKIYENEECIGEAIRQSKVNRQHIFVTTKLWNDDHGYKSTIAACLASLERLGLDYIDLYLIHWPVTSRRLESWRAMVDLQKRGLVRHIGVSNFTDRHLEEIINNFNTHPDVNQVEFHPFIYLQQKQLLAFCKKHGIVIEAYSPLVRLNRGINPVIMEIASKIKKTPSQVVLRWCIQHGTVPLPRSQNPEHIKNNLEVFDFELDEVAMQSLDCLSDGIRVTWDPAGIH